MVHWQYLIFVQIYISVVLYVCDRVKSAHKLIFVRPFTYEVNKQLNFERYRQYEKYTLVFFCIM